MTPSVSRTAGGADDVDRTLPPSTSVLGAVVCLCALALVVSATPLPLGDALSFSPVVPIGGTLGRRLAVPCLVFVLALGLVLGY